jgi:mRNA-degrading endonuclease toxin of MazEF toxin-antitoxin module
VRFHLADIFEGGTRPVVIVSREELNRGALCLAVPITSSRVDEWRRTRITSACLLEPVASEKTRLRLRILCEPVRTEFFASSMGRTFRAVARAAPVESPPELKKPAAERDGDGYGI